MNYDDIERQMLIMDLEADYLEVVEKKESEYKAPDWFLIGNGLEDADERTKFKAREILKEFIRFSSGVSKPDNAKTFQELVEAFTLSKVQNK